MARTPVRLWLAGGVALSVLLALAGWMFVLAPQRAGAAEQWAEVEQAQGQIGSLRARTSVLATQFESIDERRAALAVKQEALPAANELESLVRALAETAAEADVAVEEITSGGPIDISAPTVVVAPVEPGPEATEDPTTTTEEAPSVASLYALPVTIRASGPLAGIEEFLRLVQLEQPRAILFTSITLVPNAGTTLADSVMLTAETRVFVSSPPVAAATPDPGE